MATLQDSSVRLSGLSDLHLNAIRESRRNVTKVSLVYSALLFLVLGNIAVKLKYMSVTYSQEYAWYANAFSVGQTMPSMRGPDIQDVCMCVSYNQLYKVKNTFSNGFYLNEESSKFLIMMIKAFGKQMSAVHWCGSEAQLGGLQFIRFLGLTQNAATDEERWESWNHVDNKWRFLFNSPEQLHMSLAYRSIRDKLKNGATLEELKSTNFLFMLYADGGITAAVMKKTSEVSTLSISDLMYELMGFRVKFKRSCDGARWGALSQTMTACAPVLMASPTLFVFLCVFSFFHKKCPKPIMYSDDRIDAKNDRENDDANNDEGGQYDDGTGDNISKVVG